MVVLGTLALTIGYTLAPSWVAPALYYNLEWHAPDKLWDNVWATLYVAGGALCFAALHVVRDAAMKWLAVALGIILVLNNSWNALDTLAHSADSRVDSRKTEITDFSDRQSQRSAWSRTIADAEKKVGTDSVEAIQAELDAHIAKGAKMWQATNECDPMEINKAATFCSTANTLKGKVATATKRDEAQAKLDDDTRVNGGKKAPTNADPMGALFASLMATFNAVLSPDGQKGVRAWRVVVNTLALEAMAAIMPMIHIAVLRAIAAGIKGAVRIADARRANAQRRRQEPRSNPTTLEPAAPPKPEPKVAITPEFERWAADELEEGATYNIGATESCKMHNAWLVKRNIKPVSQTQFGRMMGARFTRDEESKYRRYLGVRARIKGANLRVVS
jgi:hypothetical protein